jgi:hypothetical protein
VLGVYITHHNLWVRLSDHGDEQVIAPFLIILRVANRSALTSDTIISGNVGSLQFRGQEKSTSGIGTFPDEYLASSTEPDGETPGKIDVEVGAVIVEVPS